MLDGTHGHPVPVPLQPTPELIAPEIDRSGKRPGALPK
jgi:hypothetical protein